MNRAMLIFALCGLIACGAGAMVWAVGQCGLGVLAYHNPILAAATGECRSYQEPRA